MMLMKAPEQTCAFYRKGLLFVFNFHFGNSLNNVLVPVPQSGEYTVVLSSDDEKYGGFGNVKMQTYETKKFDGRYYIELYIPARTCFVLKETVIPEQPEKKAAPKKTASKKAAPKKAAEKAPKETTKKAAEKAPKETTRKAAEKAPKEATKKKKA